MNDSHHSGTGAAPGRDNVFWTNVEGSGGRLLQTAFGLTASEARVATLLAARMTNREIARELGRSEHTARRHTEKVLCKLGVRRRSDVRTVLAGQAGGARFGFAPRNAPAAAPPE